MTASSLLSFGVVYTMAIFLVFSSMGAPPASAQDYDDPPPTTPLSTPSCSDQCPCLGVGPPGPGGTPGIPGFPGSHGPQGPAGNPGNEGATGEKGARGCRGDEGEQGVAGPPGDPGMDGTDGATGLKGDKGDEGVAGPSGADGEKGTKGDTGSPGSQGSKGEPGGTPSIPPPMSAFRVQRSSYIQVTSGYQTVGFNYIKLDIGNDIGPTSGEKSGVFTCRIPGLYNFAFNGRSNSASSSNYVQIYLMHNANQVVYASSYPGGTTATVTLSTILALERDDEVYIRAHSPTYLSGGPSIDFSGYLIYEIPEAK